ncbi:MAG: hypothetical protein ACP5SH_06100 [Syntrophobacteraceae bacterium]
MKQTRHSVQKERLGWAILEELPAAGILERDRERRAASRLFHNHLAVYGQGRVVCRGLVHREECNLDETLFGAWAIVNGDRA